MTEKNEHMDLCTNCLNTKDCFYYKTKKGPIHFCEEFTCKDPGSSLKDVERLKRAESLYLPVSKPKLFDDCGKSARHGNYVFGANVAGFRRVADAIIDQKSV